jgi:hypothetical protein
VLKKVITLTQINNASIISTPFITTWPSTTT